MEHTNISEGKTDLDENLKKKNDRRVRQIQREDGVYVHSAINVVGVQDKDKILELFDGFWEAVQEVVNSDKQKS